MRSQVHEGEGFGGDWEQGFINNYDEFLTRDEAWIIAVEKGQIFKKCYENQNSRLFSENIY